MPAGSRITVETVEIFCDRTYGEIFHKAFDPFRRKYDQNLSLLDGKISITVLNAIQDSTTVKASKNGTCQIVEIPADNKKDTYRIIC